MNETTEFPFAVLVEPARDGTALVRCAGTMDVASLPRFDEVVLPLEARGRPILLDLSAVTFMDSSGLRQVFEQVKRGELSGAGVRVVAASEPVRTLLELTCLTERVGLVPGGAA